MTDSDADQPEPDVTDHHRSGAANPDAPLKNKDNSPSLEPEPSSGDAGPDPTPDHDDNIDDGPELEDKSDELEPPTGRTTSKEAGTEEPSEDGLAAIWATLAAIWTALPGIQDLEDRLAKALNITSSRDRFMFDTAFNFIIILFAAIIVDMFYLAMTQDVNSLYHIQKLIAKTLVAILKFQGLESGYFEVQGGTPAVSTPGLTASWEITKDCSGIRETLFLGVLVLCFRGVRWQVRVKWAIIFSVVIFVENLIRILSNYPIEQTYDFATWDKFHYYWWNIGQYFVVMTLFMLWVIFVAQKDIMEQERELRRRKKESKEKAASEIPE